MKGKLILVVGPSGSGKHTLISHVRQVLPNIIYPVSCSTRLPRPGEIEGYTYYFISNEAFDAHIEEGAFLEWATFSGNRYGTLKSEILPQLAEGKTVLREVDVQGVRHLQAALPSEVLATIFINAGSWEELTKRVQNRAAMSQAQLDARKARYEDEMTFMPSADRIVQNVDGKLDEAKEAFVQAVVDLSNRDKAALGAVQ